MKLKELTHLEMFRTLQIFNELKQSHLKKLARIAEDRFFEANEIIYREGELGKGIYIIKEGEVVIEMDLPSHGPVTLYTLKSGQLFGWSSLIVNRRKKARARTVVPTSVVFIEVDKIRTLFKSDQNLECELMRCVSSVITDRLYLTRDTLAHKST